jgi:hypothetical protein
MRMDFGLRAPKLAVEHTNCDGDLSCAAPIRPRAQGNSDHSFEAANGSLYQGTTSISKPASAACRPAFAQSTSLPELRFEPPGVTRRCRSGPIGSVSLEHALRQVHSDCTNFCHGRLPQWCSTPPLWHTRAVGGVHTIKVPGGESPDQTPVHENRSKEQQIEAEFE